MKKIINAVLVDDEPKMLELLVDSLSSLFPDIAISGQYTTWKAALHGIKEHSPDIIFMDISMPEKSGFDLLDLLPKQSSEIIFVTAHSEFAIEAFEHAAVGYLLKPINDRKLADTVNRAIKVIEQKSNVQQSNSVNKIGIPDSDSIAYYNIDDILYIETINRYTKVVTTDKEIISSYSLGMYKKSLPADIFYSVHRSFIINLNHVVKFDTNSFVIMTNQKEIPVSKAHKDELLKKFNKIGR